VRVVRCTSLLSLFSGAEAGRSGGRGRPVSWGGRTTTKREQAGRLRMLMSWRVGWSAVRWSVARARCSSPPQRRPRPRPAGHRRHHAGGDMVGARQRVRLDRSVGHRSRPADLGPRELLDDPEWSGRLRWTDRHSTKRSGHRPDLVAFLSDQAIPIEVELANKSKSRLDAILNLHANWIIARKSAALIYICGDEEGYRRVELPRAALGSFRITGSYGSNCSTPSKPRLAPPSTNPVAAARWRHNLASAPSDESSAAAAGIRLVRPPAARHRRKRQPRERRGPTAASAAR
jgi:hypothetical protein